MAKLPPVTRIIQEDFKEQSSWIGKLLQPINSFMTSIVSALSHGLTFGDNFAAQVKDLEFSENANTYPLYFKSTTATKPVGLWVVNASEIAATPSPILNAVYADWEYADGQVRINNITGLTTGKKYRILVVAISG